MGRDTGESSKSGEHYGAVKSGGTGTACYSNVAYTEGIVGIVLDTVKEYNMLSPGEAVVVGVSGGADSVCLLYILRQLGMDVHAVHINHNIRGTAAKRDEDYVKQLAEKMNISVYVHNVDVPKLAESLRISEEVAGREARYRCFFEVARKLSIKKIAVAQNMNDQAETIVMRFIRGSGLGGLGSIQPVSEREGFIILRPLLYVPRSAIEKFCADQDINFCTDDTNFAPIYTRNKIRLELLPQIEKYNPSIVKILSNTAKMLSQDNDFLEQAVVDCHKHLKPERHGISIEWDILQSLHISIQRRLVITAVNRAAAVDYTTAKTTNTNSTFVKDIEYRHVCDILDMQKKNTTALSLPHNMRVVNTDGKIFFEKYAAPEKIIVEHPLNIGVNYVKEFNCSIDISIMGISQFKESDFIHHNDVVCFDYDKLQVQFDLSLLCVRNRRARDRFIPFGMKGYKKLKDFYIDMKIPIYQRDMVPIVAVDWFILWVGGYRRAEGFRVESSTEKVLVLRLKFAHI